MRGPRIRTALLLSALAAALYWHGPVPGTPQALAQDPGSGEISELRAQGLEPMLHERVNEIRRLHGLETLSWDFQLNIMAFAHSQDMAARDFFSHQNPDGLSPDDRATRAGYTCEVRVGSTIYTIGENLGKVSIYDGYTYNRETGEVVQYDYRTDDEIADAVVSAWMESPGHRENILREFWRAEGIAVVMTGDGLVLVTQNFC
ncbi:MAG: CAP domain-containing protein [Thermodesulfovibrionales bacterium]|nr:CAP domain-containing protein [Thermodesulfovibrionales bacterium]